MAEDSALEREFRELLNTLVRLSHIGRVLRIGTAELVADVAHGVAEDEQRPRRIEHAYMTRCVPGGRDHAQAEHFVVITDRLKQPRRLDLRDIRGARVRRRLGGRPEYFADAANVIGMIVCQDHVVNRIPT